LPEQLCPPPGGTVTGQSDASGHYSLTSLDPGPTGLTASAAGFDPASETVNVVPGADTVVALVLTPASATIKGTVTDAGDESPVEGATVTGKSPSNSMSASTDANGAYTLSGVPAGQVEVTAAQKFYHGGQGMLTVAAHQTLIQDFPLLRLLDNPKS
jgi:hypothetical protein